MRITLKSRMSMWMWMWRTLQRAAAAFVPLVRRPPARMPALHAKACATSPRKLGFRSATVCGVLFAAFAFAQHDLITPETSFLPVDHPAIQYNDPSQDDAVAKLNRLLATGKAKLEYTPGIGYLPSVLKNLGINPDSQTMVFSKTSFQ